MPITPIRSKWPGKITDRERFVLFYYGYVLMRCIQVLGAYGFRGFHERKPQFLQSVPYAIRNLEHLLGHARWPVEMPELLLQCPKISLPTIVPLINLLKLDLELNP